MSLLKKKGDTLEQEELTYQQRKAAQKAAEKEAKASGETPKKRRMSLKEEREAVRSIRTERKVLRKQLRKQGIKNKRDFEMFAAEVGLGYPEDTTAAFIAGKSAALSGILSTTMASVSAVKLLLIASFILGMTLYTAYVTEEKGHFTVNVTADMLQQGFQISETADFSGDVTRLFAQEITNSNATSIYEISRNINAVDGSHNGPGYMAYTFYLKNNGTEVTDYAYTVNILSETLNTAAATWVMFFEDDHQIIYAKAQEDGRPENLFGYRDAPFAETAFDPASQYYTESGKYGIVTTPYLDDYTALQGYVDEFEPGEVKKYTVVVWLEGDDPDCNNSILGGHVGFNVQFERIGEENTDFFKGMFRQEYEKSFYGEDAPGTDSSHAGTGEWEGSAGEQTQVDR